MLVGCLLRQICIEGDERVGRCRNFLCTYLGFFGVFSTENLMAILNIYMIKGFGVELAELCVENGVFGVGHLGF